MSTVTPLFTTFTDTEGVEHRVTRVYKRTHKKREQHGFTDRFGSMSKSEFFDTPEAAAAARDKYIAEQGAEAPEPTYTGTEANDLVALAKVKPQPVAAPDSSRDEDGQDRVLQYIAEVSGAEELRCEALGNGDLMVTNPVPDGAGHSSTIYVIPAQPDHAEDYRVVR